MILVKGKVNWIDITKPSPQDIDFLQKRHKFHSLILDEVLHSSLRPRVENHGSYLFFTHYVPVFDAETQVTRKEEIDFLITHHDVITVHYTTIEPLEALYRKLVNDEAYKKDLLGSDTAKLLYYIIESLIHFSKRQTHHINQDINYISNEIFSHREEELLKKISLVKRTVLDHQIIIQPQENILNTLLENSGKFWKDANTIYLTDLVGDYFKVAQELKNYQKIIESIEATNSQLLNAKINKTMQRFTALAFLTYPLFVITSLLSLKPILNYIGEDNVWVAIGTSLAIIVALYFVFKKKKLL